MCADVAMLRIYPSIMASTVRHFLKLPIRGVVLQCYGAGNIPSNRQDILDAIRDGASSGVIILVVTQVRYHWDLDFHVFCVGLDIGLRRLNSLLAILVIPRYNIQIIISASL